MNKLDDLLGFARENKCSDIHLSYQLPPMARVNGKLVKIPGYEPFTDEVLQDYIQEMIHQEDQTLVEGQDLDFCYNSADGGRNRINIYRQQKHYGAAVRLLSAQIPTLEELNIMPVCKDLSMLKRGLVLVTGPTGSGKSTTLAACIDYMNRNRAEHIITIEDPVEYIHQNKKCMLNQREIGVDCESFVSSLRSALREDPDIILVGEMRDLETIASAVTAAETGHLVFSTLHTTGAAATIDRIIDVFPPHQQGQIRIQLASVLKGVISQQLIPKADGSGRVAAQEVLLVNDAVANMIRENKCYQISSVLQTNNKLGMQSMDAHLLQLAQKQIISPESAIDYGIDKTMLAQKLSSVMK